MLRAITRPVAFLIATTSIGAVSARAQVPTPDFAISDADQPRPGRWRVVRSPHFDVMFQPGLEEAAQRTANSLERAHAAIGRTMGGSPRRTTVVLHSQSIRSNALAGLAPRREVWIATPPAFLGLLGTGDWLTLLSVHETRHMAQNDRTRVGFTRLGWTILGEVGQLGLSHLAVPGWMWEGDAVGIETAFTDFGRGRMPSFDKEIRSLALDGRLPGYYAAMLGTYRSFFPNEYPLGYFLTTSLRRQHGPDAVSELFGRASAHSYNPLAFHLATRSVVGMTPPQLYDATMRELTSLWREQAAAMDTTPARRLTRAPRTYTSFQNPQYLGDGSVIALRSGLADRPQIVSVTPSGVSVLADAPAIGGVRAGGMAAAWAERVPDLRWGWSDDNRIRLLELDRGDVRTVARGRFAFPSPSPDGKRIAVVELRRDLSSAVVVLDAVSGERMLEVPVPDGEHAMEPTWRADGQALAMTRQGTRGKALSVLDVASRRWRDVIPHGTEDVSNPVYAGEKVLFISPWSGIDNVHAVDPESGARWQVTSRRIGAYQPAVSADGTRMLHADYTSDGFVVVESAIDTTLWQPLDHARRAPVAYRDTLVAQERFTMRPVSPQTDSIVDYPVGRPGLRSAINVHSWAWAGNPFAGDLGATVLSSNVLNTLNSSLTYIYHRREQASEVKTSVSYAGLFPIVDVGARYGARVARYETPVEQSRVSWNERAIEAGMRVPLNLSRGIWTRGLSLGAQLSAVHVSDLEVPARSPGNGTFAPVTTGLLFHNLQARAPRDLAPRWGQRFSIQQRSTPIGGDFQPWKTAGEGRLFFPGFRKHHTLQLSGAIERHRPDEGIIFSTDIRQARGYRFVFGTSMAQASADYGAPLAYPDLALGPVFYIPRVQLGAFADYFRSAGNVQSRELASAGLSVSADVIPFTWTLFQFTAGARVLRRHDGRWVADVVVGSPF